MPKGTTLTPRERLFVAEYMIDKNGGPAILRAGYKSSTPSAARTAAYQLLQKPAIKAALEAALSAQEKRTLITADRVLLDIQDGGDVALKAKRFDSFLRSRELLGKHYKLFTDKLDVSGELGLKVSAAAATDDELMAVIANAHGRSKTAAPRAKRKAKT